MKSNKGFRLLLPFFVILSVLTAAAPIAHAARPEADGTEAVSTEQELRFALSRDSYPKLTKDIKLTSCLTISKRATILLEGKRLYRELSESAADGHVIEVQSGGNLTLKNSAEADAVITGGYAEQGGAILNNGTLKIEHITIENNKAQSGGGIWSHGKLELTNVTLRHNTTNNGEGGNLWTDSTSTLNHVTIVEGDAKLGGGIFNKGGMTLKNSTLRINTATDGGGILNHGILTCSDSALDNNTAVEGGGGNLWNDSMATLNSVTVTNGAAGNGGGIADHGTLTLKNCTLQGNEATGRGGAVFFNSYSDGRHLNLTGTTAVTQNKAGESGAGVFVDAASKGDVYMQEKPVVKDNKTSAGAHHNLYLEGEKKIRFLDDMDAEAAVYLSLERGKGIFTDGLAKTAVTNVFHGENNEEIITVSIDPSSDDSPKELHLGTYLAELIKAKKLPDGKTETTKQHYYDIATVWNAAFTEAGHVDSVLIVLNGNCETDKPLYADADGVTLDLNGYTLKRVGADNSADGEVITVRFGAEFTIQDSAPKRRPEGRGKSEPRGGVITGGSSKNSGGGIVVCETATLHLNGGTLYRNRSNSNGGAVYVLGTLNMNGGAIRENIGAGTGGGIYLDRESAATIKNATLSQNTAGHGGAVENDGGTLTLSACTLTENTADGDGGAVEIRGNAKRTVLADSKLTGNTAKSSGGAIYVNSNQLFLSSCEIQNNQAPAKKGGGIFVQKGRHISIQGQTVIAGNIELTDGRPSVTNVALAYTDSKNQSFIQNAGLSEGSRIGLERVHAEGKAVQSNQVLVVKNCTVYQMGYYFADSGELSHRETGDREEVFMATSVRPFGYAVYPLIAAELVAGATVLVRTRMKKKEKAKAQTENKEGK